MPQDAYTLRHIARELNAALSGGKVNKIIQPSRDEVDILLYAGGKTQKLLLNTHATFARAVLSRQARTAPEVAPNFCMLLRKHLTGAQLTSVTQLGFERILGFAFDCTGEFARAERVLYAEIMGKYSNLVLTENGVILGALKVSSLQENFKRVLFPGVKYTPPAAQDKADPTDRAALAARLSAFSGGDLARFLSANVAGLAYSTCALLAPKLPQDAPAEELADSLRALIFSDETAPAVERVNGEPTDFHARFDGGERYASVLEAADSYYTEREEKRGREAQAGERAARAAEKGGEKARPARRAQARLRGHGEEPPVRRTAHREPVRRAPRRGKLYPAKLVRGRLPFRYRPAGQAADPFAERAEVLQKVQQIEAHPRRRRAADRGGGGGTRLHAEHAVRGAGRRGRRRPCGDGGGTARGGGAPRAAEKEECARKAKPLPRL